MDDSSEFTDYRGLEREYGEDGYGILPFGKGKPPRRLGIIGRDRFGGFDIENSHGECYPYLLKLTSLRLTELTKLENYSTVTYIDLTYNKLTNQGLDSLKFMINLITLIMDHNKIRSTVLPEMINLEYLSLNKNLITSIKSFRQPNLKYLFLNENSITYVKNVDSISLPKLHTLSISFCKLKSMNTNYANTLERLYLTNNNILSIQGINDLENLKILHLRGNQISSLKGFSKQLKELFYINLRTNNISEEKELKNLELLPMLRILILTGNTIDDDLGVELREKILVIQPDMRRINKFLIDDNEEERAREIIAELLEKKERRQRRLQRLRKLGEFAVEGENDNNAE